MKKKMQEFIKLIKAGGFSFLAILMILLIIFLPNIFLNIYFLLLFLFILLFLVIIELNKKEIIILIGLFGYLILVYSFLAKILFKLFSSMPIYFHLFLPIICIFVLLILIIHFAKKIL